jgi:hypothetical protein
VSHPKPITFGASALPYKRRLYAKRDKETAQCGWCDRVALYRFPIGKGKTKGACRNHIEELKAVRWVPAEDKEP